MAKATSIVARPPLYVRALGILPAKERCNTFMKSKEHNFSMDDENALTVGREQLSKQHKAGRDVHVK
jgi:hypothetical protein